MTFCENFTSAPVTEVFTLYVDVFEIFLKVTDHGETNLELPDQQCEFYKVKEKAKIFYRFYLALCMGKSI